MPVRPAERELDEFLTRAVAEVVVRDDLAAALRSGERALRIKQGFDPTHPNLHLGHAVPLRKLRQLARWGHEIVLIIGDWTTQVGDPTDRELTRPLKSRDEVMANARTYLDQFHLVVPRENTRIELQDPWFGKFGLRDVLQLASRFTVQQMLAREEFRNRIDKKTPIPIKDLLYPLLQAYDSVAIEADVEVGGTDQLFNVLAGRELQQALGQRPQNVLITQLLEGLDGEKMSKSKPLTAIWLTDQPHEVYGKVMSIEDRLMPHYFEWATELPLTEVRVTLDALGRGDLHPREAKERLAWRITSELHSGGAADEAAAGFRRQFKQGLGPAQAKRTKVQRALFAVDSDVSLVDLLVALGLVRNKAEGRDTLKSGGVRVNGQVVDGSARVPPGFEGLIQVGRRLVQPDWE